MGIVEQLPEDLKAAMRAGETLRRDTLRMVMADLKNRRIELGRDLDDEQAQAVLRGAIKRRQESAEQYDKAERAELAERERAEITMIEGYLPAQLGPDEVRAAIEAVVREVGATGKQDMGAVMKALMARHKGEIDGRTANQILGEILS